MKTPLIEPLTAQVLEIYNRTELEIPTDSIHELQFSNRRYARFRKNYHDTVAGKRGDRFCSRPFHSIPVSSRTEKQHEFTAVCDYYQKQLHADWLNSSRLRAPGNPGTHRPNWDSFYNATAMLAHYDDQWDAMLYQRTDAGESVSYFHNLQFFRGADREVIAWVK